jgi:hypothetical protein
MLLVLLNTCGCFSEASVEPAVDSGYGQTDVMVLFELFLYLCATPTKLVADVDYLLDYVFWDLG